VRVRNLLPACKNIGATHITNGCYRLHPVEWNIGESAGLLAAFCILCSVETHQVYETPALIATNGVHIAPNSPQARQLATEGLTKPRNKLNLDELSL
jgi:hypothetical protein